MWLERLHSPRKLDITEETHHHDCVLRVTLCLFVLCSHHAHIPWGLSGGDGGDARMQLCVSGLWCFTDTAGKRRSREEQDLVAMTIRE